MLFERGDFRLHAGGRSPFKIECDGLTDDDWDTLAMLVASRLMGEAREIVGIPRGGLKFADALRRHVTVRPEHGDLPRLVVDDVYTTGASMTPYREYEPGRGERTIGVVAFSRGERPPWVFALFDLAEWASKGR